MTRFDEGFYEVPGLDFDPNPRIESARRAGRRALLCLDHSEDRLRAASGLGLLDIFGGGILTGILKQQQISEANVALAEAAHALEDFRRELGAVDGPVGIDPRVASGFWTIADIILDGPMTDVIVQRKIEDARSRVEAARSGVRNALSRLGG